MTVDESMAALGNCGVDGLGDGVEILDRLAGETQLDGQVLLGALALRRLTLIKVLALIRIILKHHLHHGDIITIEALPRVALAERRVDDEADRRAVGRRLELLLRVYVICSRASQTERISQRPSPGSQCSRRARTVVCCPQTGHDLHRLAAVVATGALPTGELAEGIKARHRRRHERAHGRPRVSSEVPCSPFVTAADPQSVELIRAKCYTSSTVDLPPSPHPRLLTKSPAHVSTPLRRAIITRCGVPTPSASRITTPMRFVTRQRLQGQQDPSQSASERFT